MRCDFSCGQALGREEQDDLVDSGQASLPFLDDLTRSDLPGVNQSAIWFADCSYASASAYL
jgi:hypothetical protein